MEKFKAFVDEFNFRMAIDDVNLVAIYVFTKNPYAQKLYRKSGYQVRGYADWRKGRFDLMEKKL